MIYGALNIQAFHLGVPELLQLIFKNQSLTGFALAPLLSSPTQLRRSLEELFALAADGSLRVSVGGAFALERASDAHVALEQRATTGKVVINP